MAGQNAKISVDVLRSPCYQYSRPKFHSRHRLDLYESWKGPVSTMSGNYDELGSGVRMTPEFQTTHWSVVLAARDAESPQAAEALAKLCHAYWYPIYAYVRRRGHQPHDAQDLTQEFFARLLEKNILSAVRQERGKFRSFIRLAVSRFLTSEWRCEHAAKRGGAHTILSLDETTAEGRYRLEPADHATPETVFDRNWAVILLEQAHNKLRSEYEKGGRSPTFVGLEPFLSGDPASESYAELGVRLGMSANAVKVAVHRLRERYGECLRQQIAQTVSTPAEVEEEIRQLFAIFSG